MFYMINVYDKAVAKVACQLDGSGSHCCLPLFHDGIVGGLRSSAGPQALDWIRWSPRGSMTLFQE